MSNYYILQSPDTPDPAQAKIVQDGFSWLALGSPTIWSLRHGLWEMVAVNIVFSYMLANLVMPHIAGVILFAWHISFAMLSGNIHAQFLIWRAYKLRAYIPNAYNAEAAFIQWIYTK